MAQRRSIRDFFFPASPPRQSHPPPPHADGDGFSTASPSATSLLAISPDQSPISPMQQPSEQHYPQSPPATSGKPAEGEEADEEEGLTAMDLLKRQKARERAAMIERCNNMWLTALDLPDANIDTVPQCMEFSSPEGNGDHDLVVADFGATPDWLLDMFKESLTFVGDPVVAKMEPPATTKVKVEQKQTHWAEFSTRLKTFSGMQKVAESALPNPPTALVEFYPDNLTPRLPALALAAGGPHIYMYRDRRPFYRFSLPNVEPDVMELEVWSNLRQAIVGPIEYLAVCVESAFVRLRHLRMTGHAVLTSRSLKFLRLGRDAKGSVGADDVVCAFVKESAETPLIIKPCITCLRVLKHGSNRDDEMGMLVVGSEERIVYIVTPPNYIIVEKFQLSSPLVFLATSGHYTGEYHIAASCRDNVIYLLSKDQCYRVVQTETPASGLILRGSFITVSCMNSTVCKYDLKGRINSTVELPAPITSLEPIVINNRNYQGVGHAVGLLSGEVHIYASDGLNINPQLISILSFPAPIVAIKFGNYGRQSDALVVVQNTGALSVRLLRRNADVGPLNTPVVARGEVKIHVPKKSKLYVENVKRERREAKDMFVAFKDGMGKMKTLVERKWEEVEKGRCVPLTAEQSTPHDIESAKNKNASLIHEKRLPIRLEAAISGMGPVFKITMRLINLSNISQHEVILALSASHETHYLTKALILIKDIPGRSAVTRSTLIVCKDNTSLGKVRIVMYNGRKRRSGNSIMADAVTFVSVPAPLLVGLEINDGDLDDIEDDDHEDW